MFPWFWLIFCYPDPDNLYGYDTDRLDLNHYNWKLTILNYTKWFLGKYESSAWSWINSETATSGELFYISGLCVSFTCIFLILFFFSHSLSFLIHCVIFVSLLPVFFFFSFWSLIHYPFLFIVLSLCLFLPEYLSLHHLISVFLSFSVLCSVYLFHSLKWSLQGHCHRRALSKLVISLYFLISSFFKHILFFTTFWLLYLMLSELSNWWNQGGRSGLIVSGSGSTKFDENRIRIQVNKITKLIWKNKLLILKSEPKP